MVSLQAAISQDERKASFNPGNPGSKKRKWDGEEVGGDTADFSKTASRPWRPDAASDIELHLDTPLPVEWQRCLDIKSGQIHFYNTRTQKRTSKDPRKSWEPPSSLPSLDLELNLMCRPPRGPVVDGEDRPRQESSGGGGRSNSKDNSVGGGLSPSPSWVSVDADNEEMVAAVCVRCHMLVMMCKAAPSCPNCKFVHPPDQSSSMLVKTGFRLLCCRD